MLGSFRGGEQWGLGVLRPMLPREEVASCQKVAVAALDLRGCSPLGLGGAGFVTRGDSGSWAGTWQTRCVGGTKPLLPGTSKPAWGLLTGTELPLHPPGMSQEWVFLVFPRIPLYFPQFCLETPLLHQGADVPLGDTVSKP